MCSSIYFTQNAQTCDMPDYFTHAILAGAIYEGLDSRERAKITDKKLYFLGAQGGDAMFFYRLSRKNNLGRSLHRQHPTEMFLKLLGTHPAYAAGWATHYAADSTLHPAVYAFERASRAPFAHLAFERYLGLYVSQKFSCPRKIMPKDDLLSCKDEVFSALSALGCDVTEQGVERGLERYFCYTRSVYARKRQSYKFDYDYPSLAPLVDGAVQKGIRAATCVLEGRVDGELFAASFLQGRQ